MKKILRKHPELFLSILALLFIVLLISVFSWGVGDVVESVNKAVNADAGGTGATSFNLGQAKGLDLRGLVK